MTAADGWKLAGRMTGGGRLSVVMPVYNLGGVIAGNLERTSRIFSEAGVSAEIIPVDDGSTDSTWSEIGAYVSAVRQSSPVEVRPVRLPRNGGKGAALKAGFEASRGEYILLLDGDLDVKPELAPGFFVAMAEADADIVIGSKRHRDSQVQYPWHRRLASWGYFALVRAFIGLKVSDTQTGMKLFKRKILGDALDRMLVKTYAFDLELLAIAHSRGAKIAEAPVAIEFGRKFGCLNAHTVKTMAWDSLAVFYRLRLLGYYAKVEVPPKPEKEISVSVVIACPKSSWMLSECLAALKRQTFRNFEVIVLPDGPEEFAGETEGLEAKVIPTGKVRPAEKRNIGINAAGGEVVAFIDDDAYPDDNWLEQAVRYFSVPEIGAVGGPAITPASDPYLSRIGGRIYDNILVSGSYRYRYREGGVRLDVDDYPSCNLLVRKRLLDDIGGYRTDFWPGEDTLLCKDIVDAGFRIVYDPWVVVSHHRRAVFGPHLRQLRRYAFHRGYFVKRFPSNSARLAYFVPSAFVVYAAALAVGALAFYHNALPGGAAFMAALSAPMALYLALSLATAFAFNPCTWLLTWAGIALTHVVYGVWFIVGLAAAKSPCEYIGKDHA